MIVPTWQEIIDDIIEVLSSRQASNLNERFSIYTQKDESVEDMLDVLIAHKFECGHIVKVPKHSYSALYKDFPSVCELCAS